MMMNDVIKISAGLAAVLAFGCAPSVQTIDRTQPNALHKSQFEGIWYHRSMVVESDPQAGPIEGITSNMEKLRWDITEGLLIGYRTYEFLPYAEGLTDEGRDFFGAPVVAYAITSHFDIQREYNAVTGVETNVVSENTADRPWYQREYMRVDWTTNLVGSRFVTGFVSYPDAYLSAVSAVKYFAQGETETDVDRPIFTEDYFDITNRLSLEPNASYCILMLLIQSTPRCGTANSKVRLSFRKVDPSDDYETLYYPDELELKDDAGNALILNFDGRECDANRDPSECSARTFWMDGRFGNFRRQRNAFDRERFLTRTGRIFVAGRYDIWQDHFDEQGSVIPFTAREAKPIVYYGNVKFPTDMVAPAEKMATFYNVPFSEIIAFHKGYFDSEGRPDWQRVNNEMGQDMFQFRVNDCSPENVRNYANANGLMDVVNRIAGSADRLAPGNIEQVCAAMQYTELQSGKTLDPKVAARTGQSLAFTWQRKGDLRINMNNYISQDQGGPWGVAQFGQDPETGEFVGNIANYFGNAGDVISQRGVDIIQWLNGDLDEQELFRGDIARNTVVSRRSVKNNGIRDVVMQALKAHEDNTLDKIGGQILAEASVLSEEERFERMFGGTDIERDLLVNDELLRGLAGPELFQPLGGAPLGATGSLAGGSPLVPGEISQNAIDAASPISWGVTPETNEYMVAAYEFGRRGVDMADFFDPNFSGLAEFFKGEDRDYIWDWMRHELFTAVQGHEVGHTVGLRHNFAASMDPANYRPEFWWLETDDGSEPIQYWDPENHPTPDFKHRGNEYKYASIMDYGFDLALEGLHGLGRYDEAAIRFIYGQLMEVWDNAKVSIPDPRKYGTYAQRCGYDSDYMSNGFFLFWLTPESYPRLFSSTPKDQRPCANQYDNPNIGDTCDSEIDGIMREFAIRNEAANLGNNEPTSCGLFIADLNWLFDQVKSLPPNAQNLANARKLVRVEDMIRQEIEVLTNPPEYDDLATTENEAANLVDDDEDGVLDDKGYDWSRYMHPVNYEYCSDLFANFSNPYCQRWDTGWDFEEATDYHVNRHDRDYIFNHFRRDAFSASGWGNPRSYMSRLLSRRLFHMVNTFRYFLYTRRTALEADRFIDWREAAYKGVNMLDRMIQEPEPGTYCLNEAENRYEMWTGAGEPTEAQCNAKFTTELGYGGGRYLNSSWTNEYFYKANRIGYLYDKLAAIQQMTSSSGRFVRDISDLFDRRAFSLGYLRVYLDPMLQRFAALIEGDHWGYRPRVVGTPPAGGGDDERFVRYMPLFDEEADEAGASVREQLEPLPYIEPAWSWTLQYWALAFAISNWSSVNDYAPEFYRLTKIAVAGTAEDVEYPPNVEVIEYTDPQTLITYRAPVIEAFVDPGIQNQEFEAYFGDRAHRQRGEFRNWGIGANLLEDAKLFTEDVYNPALTACEAAGRPSTACDELDRAALTLNEKVGFIDQVRKYNARAENPF